MEPQMPSLEQTQEWNYNQKKRELKIARTRALLLRKQIIEAYGLLENIRFDYLGDTAFRDKITKAKIGLEDALADFLLDDNYWQEKQAKHKSMTPKEYHNSFDNAGNPMQSMKLPN